MQMARVIAISLLALLVQACVSAPESRPRPRNPVFIPAPKPTPRPVSPRPVSVSDPTRPNPAMAESIRSLWLSYPDKTGIAVIRDNGSWIIEQRGAELFPQQSVSKLWVGIALMDAVDQGRLRLSDDITVTGSDLAVFSTSMQQLIDADGFQTTLGELLDRAMTKSDNTANDVLMRKVGGPAAIRAMISAKGLGAIRFGPGENLLQAGTAGLGWQDSYKYGKAFQAARAKLSEEARTKAMDRYLADPPDGASPIAIAKALLRLKRGELLSASSTQHLLTLMANSETGKQRLRAGTPYDWTFAHKTGTGQDHKGRNAGYNDVSIMTAPDGTSYAVVVMIADTRQPVPTRMELMQGISATVGANHQR
jgi:beta-lactamase class A